MIDFVESIKALLRKKDMTQAKLAICLGVNRPVLTMVLTRAMKLPAKYLDPLLDALDVSGSDRECLRLAHMASVSPSAVREVAERAAAAATAKVMALPAVQALVVAEEKFGGLPEKVQRGARRGYYGAVIDQMRAADVITAKQHKALEDRLKEISAPGGFPEIVARMALCLTSAIATAGKEEEFEELIRRLGEGTVDRFVDAAKGALEGPSATGARRRRR